jgi:hypothetical protein
MSTIVERSFECGDTSRFSIAMKSGENNNLGSFTFIEEN